MVDATARHSQEFVQKLRSALAALPVEGKRFWVAYSGGRDSTALLHAMWRLCTDSGIPLYAAHVNHGLQSEAGAWAERCRRFCRQLGVGLECIDIDARTPAGKSPEAWARQCRYRALGRVLRPDEVLLTAHHQEDQAETLLLQLLRGAGPRGLAAMGTCMAFGAGWHVRPMLGCSRREIDAYAHYHELSWCEDPSNLQTQFQRNFLRREVLPRLGERWPAWPATLSRAAAWQADAAAILAQAGADDLAAIGEDDGRLIVIEELLRLDTPRRRNVLRFWLEQRGLPPPHAVQLDEMLNAIDVRDDARICVCWEGGELRRHAGRLHVTRGLPPSQPGLTLPWPDLSSPLALPLGRLEASPRHGGGIGAARLGGHSVTVRFRQGGERCRPVGRAHTQTLKRLMQEDAIPAWLRPHTPLLYCDDTLAAVGDRWVCESFQAQPGEQGWVLAWRTDDMQPVSETPAPTDKT